ncbi:MAG TPA: hypothetical protein VE890_06530, partial [Thermoguttaceae bacterium]|nr:hypothetical protein [Thermoguttaceae bacterium]
MKMDNHNADRVTRRRLLQGAAGAVAAAAAVGSAEAGPLGLRKRTKAEPQCRQGVVNGRINQSICHWCFTADCSPEPWTLEQVCQRAVELGIKSV